MKAFVAVLLVSVLAGVSAGSAQGCSCALVDPRVGLQEADGAFIGVLMRREVQGVGAVLTFRVEEVFKGELGSTVEVRTNASSAGCGLDLPEGERTGLFLQRRDGAWTTHLCWQVAPADLREAARPLPAPDGAGPPALLVAGSFGEMRLLALDRRGRTLAYGRGVGTVRALSVCPGGKRTVEVALPGLGGAPMLVVRALPTLRVVRVQPAGALEQVRRLRCLDRRGLRSVVFVAPLGPAPGWARIALVTPARTTVRWSGHAADAYLGQRAAHLTTGRDGTILVRLDLVTGGRKRLGRVPHAMYALHPSPDGRHLAGLSPTRPREGEVDRMRVVVVTVDTGRFRATGTLPRGGRGAIRWIDDARLAVFPVEVPGAVEIRTAALVQTASIGRWYAQDVALARGKAFGTDWRGDLIAAALPSGSARVLRRLPGVAGGPVVVVPAPG